MKRYFNILLVMPLLFSLSSCALFEASNNDKNIVSLGNKDSYVRWNLVSNDNMLSNVKSAYFEFDNENFKYYEDGTWTNVSMRFLISELIREKILELTDEEVPHSVCVVVEEMEYNKTAVNIKATIVVDRENLKKILASPP